MDISERIINWYNGNKRDLPWRNTKNAYLIWLSEIILQQTRVDQGLPYFEKFSSQFPTVNDLANAPEQAVLKLWQGLGYYSRARNLHFTAKKVVEDWNGTFPTAFLDLKKLKGIGDYTAAAIASFAVNEKVAVLDGNVFRVLSRYFDLATPIDTTLGKKEFTLLANSIIGNNPSSHNQAMMELGSLVCKPKLANCNSCPLADTCLAFARNKVYELPVKSKKIKQRTRYFNYLVMQHADKIYLNERGPKDIWQGLFDFPLVETEQELHEVEQLNLSSNKATAKFEKDLVPMFKSEEFKHLLTHQTIRAKFWHFELKKAEKLDQLKAIIPSEIHNFPLPKLIENYIKSIFIDNIKLYKEIYLTKPQVE